MPVTKTETKRTVVPAKLATAKAAPAPAKPKLAVAKATPKAAATAPTAEPKEKKLHQRGANVELAGKKVKLLVASNPKRPNTNAAAMWEQYRNGMTYEEIREAGVSLADILYNIKHDPPFISFQ